MEGIYWCIGYKLLLPNIVKGFGTRIYDDGGNEYIDMESGVWATPLGHSNSKVNQAMKNQIDKISHTGFCYSSPIGNEAANKILEVTNIKDGKCVFLSSGSEAVEFGMQAIRKITNKQMLLTLSDSFLGSYGSSKTSSKDGWFLLDWHPCSTCPNSNDCNIQCEIFSNIPFEEIGGFIFEPGSSSGFVRFPPKSFIENLTMLIKQYNGLVQINEVTTGIGRTGKWFGFQHYDIKPDIVSMGKGLGNGYPVSAVAMTSDTIKRLDKIPFIYSQSHQNDPLGCVVAKEVINEMQINELVERSRIIGEYFINELKKVADRHGDMVKEIRGRGLMIAVEFYEELKDISSVVFEKLLESGFVLAYGRKFLRIDPPLIIETEDLDNFISALDQILSNETKRR